MNKEELQKILANEGFNSKTYSFSEAIVDEALCLRKEGDGWCVLYSERGLETGKVFFQTESEACIHFLSEMRSDPTTRSSWRSGWSL